jgi:hypothetical protein
MAAINVYLAIIVNRHSQPHCASGNSKAGCLLRDSYAAPIPDGSVFARPFVPYIHDGPGRIININSFPSRLASELIAPAVHPRPKLAEYVLWIKTRCTRTGKKNHDQTQHDYLHHPYPSSYGSSDLTFSPRPGILPCGGIRVRTYRQLLASLRICIILSDVQAAKCRRWPCGGDNPEATRRARLRGA